MTGPGSSDRGEGGRRVVILAVVFALLAQGCFILAVSFTKSPF